MFGANKTATATGGLLQLRALDWDVDGKQTKNVNNFMHSYTQHRSFQELPSGHCLPPQRGEWS